ncbi:MAG: MFS transporter [Chloroflexi bacterium]|nr:MFS transporter [Chloroflexota bacterium]
MTAHEQANNPIPHLTRSLIALISGSLLLRAAAGAMGENIQFYFNAIHEAALNPDHPLRLIAGRHNVYEVSYTIGGLIIGTFFAAELVGAPLFGAWSDRYGRKLFIIFGPLFGAIAVQITAMTTVVWMLLVTRLLEGISTAANAPATLGYIAETTSHSPKLRARVVGFFEIATIGGAAAGFSLGGWLWRHYGDAAIVAGIPLTSPAFALNAIIYLASLAILWWGLHEYREGVHTGKSASPRETWAHYWKLVTNPRVQRFAPAWIAINAVLGVFINLTARVFTDRTVFQDQLLVGRFDAFEAGNVRAAYAVIFVIGILFWSMFFAQMKKTTVMLIGTGGLFLTCLILYAINHQPSFDAPLILPLAILLAVSIVIQSGFTPAALAHLADITEEHSADRGAIMGLYSVFLGVGQFLGAALGGPFVDWRGADGIVVITALLGLFSAAMLVRLQATESRQPAIIESVAE